jgi:hypothetical protein
VLLGSALVLFPRILNCTAGFWQDGFEGWWTHAYSKDKHEPWLLTLITHGLHHRSSVGGRFLAGRRAPKFELSRRQN